MTELPTSINLSQTTKSGNSKGKGLLKIIGTVAIVGTVAALAILGLGNSQNGGNFDDRVNLYSKVDPEVEQAFNSYVSKYSKSFLTKEEFKARLAIFRNTYEEIKLHNSNKASSYKLGLNKFADWSEQEINSMLTFREPVDTDEDHTSDDEIEPMLTADQDLLGAPASVDWRAKGAVTPVLDQGRCGSCYTYSTAHAVEGAYQIKTGKLIEMSKQQLLDCTGRPYGNSGCLGGYMTNSFKYLKEYKLQSEASYPYTGKAGKCQYDASKGITNVASYTALPANDPTALLNAVAKQPVSIGVNAYGSTWLAYKSGIVDTTSCSTKLNHAVTLVGYGSENGKDYWIIKNSWGTSWGEKGYMRVKRDMATGPGICGMYKLSSYPTL